MAYRKHFGAHAVWPHASHFTGTDRTEREPRIFTVAQYRRENSRSCVYFIECGEFIKIGTTMQGAERRLATMQLPPIARLVAVIDHVGRDAELQLHRMFATARVGGEWFERTPELDAIIKTFAV